MAEGTEDQDGGKVARSGHSSFHGHHPTPTTLQRLGPAVRARAGMLVALCGTFAFSLMTVCVRMLPVVGEPVPIFMIISVRGCIVTSISLSSLLSRGLDPLGPRPYRGWLLLRGFMGFTSLSGFYYGSVSAFCNHRLRYCYASPLAPDLRVWSPPPLP